MKKLAINSFLAVTAMAWSAQSTATASVAQQLRDSARGNPPALYRAGAPNARDSQDTGAAEARSAAPFSAGERGLIRGWLRDLALPVATAPAALALGQQLDFTHLAQGRALPAWLRKSLQSRTDDVTDVLLHGRVVRLQRPGNLVVDLV